jgi:hypothetical protein
MACVRRALLVSTSPMSLRKANPTVCPQALFRHDRWSDRRVHRGRELLYRRSESFVDEPDGSATAAADLKAEADYIAAHVPGAISYMTEQNLSADTSPIFYYSR